MSRTLHETTRTSSAFRETGASGTSAAANSSDANAAFDTFCFCLLEDFMLKKNMTKTLETFRSEYAAPDEVGAFPSD